MAEKCSTFGVLQDPSVARSVRAITKEFNATAEWVTGTILEPDDESARAKRVRHWIMVADVCLKLNNFNACIQILGSLSGQAVHRLKRTWDRVGRDDMRTFQEMRRLMDVRRAAGGLCPLFP